MKTNLLDIRNCDCMEMMREYEDNHFELAIVDPPYGSKNIKGGYTKGIGGKGAADQKGYNTSLWKCESPPSRYFTELFRVSENVIMWGANHYMQAFAASDNWQTLSAPCWLVWDKQNENTGFADCELAWTNLQGAVRKFVFRWNGMLQGDMTSKEHRIHPTQKPVALYKWLLQNHAKEGDKILDTHMGSGSIAIACHYMGFNLTACELDEDYYNAACERIKRETAQTELALF